ncbi:MAG: hypothetical protein Q7R64_00815 [bacterium]|nr:hypothetical protein [bacterium]
MNFLSRTTFSKFISLVAGVLSVVFTLLIVGPVFLNAQNVPTPADEGSDEEIINEGNYNPPVYQPDFIGPTQPGQNPSRDEQAAGAAKAAANQQQTPNVNKVDLDCGLGWVTAGGSLTGCVAWTMEKAMWLSARTLWMAGVLFNITLDYTLNLNSLLEKLPIVDIGWKVLRDLANIVFIFIALWAGISITLGIGDDGKKAWGLLAQMVLVALFINFSLFIAKAVVDASNVASLHFYSLIVEPGHSKDYDKGLSEAFMYGLKLSTLYNSKALASGGVSNNNYIQSAGNSGTGAKGGLSFTNIILIGFFGSLFIIVTAWVFFAGAIMFMYRAITLIFLMMLSPLAFVGLILPGASGMAHAWWSKLWSQAFFAPLYLALAYIVVKTINTEGFAGALVNSASGSGFAAAITGDGPATVAVVFNFIMLIGLMVGCLVVAQSLGAKGSEMAMAGFEKIKNGTTSLVGRTAVRGLHFSEDGTFAKTGARWKGFGQSIQQGGGFAAKAGRLLQLDHVVGGLGKGMSKLAGKELGVRKLNEVFEKSRLGQTTFGKFTREQTTERLSHATFGGEKSAETAYEEDEHMLSRRRDIEWGAQAITSANGLRPLREEERKKQEAKLHAEEELNKAEQAYDKAKTTPGVTPEVLATLKNNVINARGNLSVATTGLNKWSEQNSAEIKKFTGAISKALAQMSTEGFLNQQKSFFTKPEVMDIAVLGADKYNALMKSEHFTEVEKHEYTEARVKRVHDVAHRGEERTQWYNEAWPRYQRSLEEFEKIVKEKIDPKSTSKSGLSLPQIQVEIAATQQALKEEAAKKPEDGRNTAKIDDLTHELTRLNTEQAEAQQAKTKLIEKGVASGELEVPKAPKQPGWEDADDVRKAMRNMRSTEEVVNWYRHARPVLNFELVEQTLMQGLLDKVRDSTEVDSEFKEQWRVDKRGYVRDAGWAVAGMDAVKMQKMHEVIGPAVDGFLQTISKQMQEVGDKQYLEEFDKKTIKGSDGKDYSAEELLTKVTDEYNSKVSEKEKITDTVPLEERKLRNRAGYAQYDKVSQNLANNEFTKMPGILRGLYIVMKKLDEATLAPYSDRDLDVKIPMLEFFLKEYLRDVQGKQKMSKENAQIWTYFVNKGGTQFIPFGNLSGENAKLMNLIASQIGRDDPRSLSAGDFGRMSNEWERAKGMGIYNSYRTATGLEPLDVEDETNLEALGIKNRRSKKP